MSRERNASGGPLSDGCHANMLTNPAGHFGQLFVGLWECIQIPDEAMQHAWYFDVINRYARIFEEARVFVAFVP